VHLPVPGHEGDGGVGGCFLRFGHQIVDQTDVGLLSRCQDLGGREGGREREGERKGGMSGK